MLVTTMASRKSRTAQYPAKGPQNGKDKVRKQPVCTGIAHGYPQGKYPASRKMTFH